MLVTHPDFRRRGAGSMICSWGEKVASKKGWTLTLFASPIGKFLYEHLGYKHVGSEQVQVDGEDEVISIDSMVKETTKVT
jgi:predicted GNAT family acetyltransferase